MVFYFYLALKSLKLPHAELRYSVILRAVRTIMLLHTNETTDKTKKQTAIRKPNGC